MLSFFILFFCANIFSLCLAMLVLTRLPGNVHRVETTETLIAKACHIFILQNIPVPCASGGILIRTASLYVIVLDLHNTPFSIEQKLPRLTS